jgi:carboxypeptidase family protein/TonB-dependent receptor-like protein
MSRQLHSRTALISFLLLALGLASASITGSISGIVSDPSGAVVSGATVTATNIQTGIQVKGVTDAKGFYNFPSLAVGTYDIEIGQTGFKTYKKTGLVIDANSALRADATLELGAISEKVEVRTDAVHVETESTQMGEVIEGKRITAVPLDGRSYTDLLALQPGVSPYTATDTGTPGISDRAVDGGLNSGNQSVNGQRESANGFMVNGSNVEEGKNNGAAIIPNLDSISEFRIITNNFDAEYGNYSGGQINVVTKSGTNQLHGSGFEFLRNTASDATPFFSSTIPLLRRNQFGGTFGGPIKKDKTFFYADYQGTRQSNALPVNIQMPSTADFAGNFSQEAQAGAFSASQTLNGQSVQEAKGVGGPAFATLLGQRLGYAVNDGEPYDYLAGEYVPNSIENGNPQQYATSCTSTTQCVFPTGAIPQKAWSPVAVNMLKLGLIPQPNAAGNFLQTTAFSQKLRDDKAGIRVDQNTHLGTFFAYYFADDYLLNSPFPNGGATVPAATFAYNAVTTGRAQLWNLGHTKNFGSFSVNEFRFSYVRNTIDLAEPLGGVGSTYSLKNLGFVTPWNAATGGISPIAPNVEGVPYTTFNNFDIGVPQVSTKQFNNSFQWLDNFTKVTGTHTIKFGGQFHYDQIDERNLAGENGQYSFTGNETGIDFADFLLGAPDSVIQASPQILDSRSKYYGLYAQDSWRATQNLVLNYGLRWEASMPWYDTQNKIETIIPGEQSRVFPGAPTGWVVPGDPGVPRTLAPTQWHNFSPRLGLAYSPGSSSGLVGKLFGGPGRTSIRLGGGIYYTSVEDLSQFLEVGDPPYGLFYGSAQPPLLEAPYLVRSTGASVGQRFPFPFPPTNVSASNPDTTFPWPQVEPISFGFSFDHRNKLPYSEHYEFSLQRQIGTNTVVTASYVGNQGHRLVTSIEANPSSPALCLFLNNPNNLAANSAGPCGPFSETPPFTINVVNGQFVGSSTPWVTATGQTIAAVRPLGPLFDTNPFVSTVANSRYNSLQLEASHNTGALALSAGYTFSKCMDNASGLQDSTYPFDPRRSIGLCNFDVTQSFVVSYEWRLPFDNLVSSRVGKAIIGGWSLSGITRFATGLPISLSENDDNALIGAGAVSVDVPNFAGGHVLADTNPRHGNPYFKTSLFSNEQLGQFGNSRRRFFHGPGLNNFDMALLRTVKITESKEIQLRVEAFNVFNHAQFQNPTGEINSSQFGLVTSVINNNPARILQAGFKFVF